MKEIIHLPPKATLSIVLFFAIVITSTVVYLGYGFYCKVKHHKDLVKKSFKGEIIFIGNPSRGFCTIRVKTDRTTFEMQSLNIARDIKNHNISVGDIVQKNINSPILEFHKKEEGSEKLYFKFTIR